MDWDEAQRQPTRSVTLGEDLAVLSVVELEARVAALAAEIDRTRAQIAAKKAHATAVSSLFKPS